jgi:ABC-type phosphate/phosphonate transport system substrate-binding protein
MSSKAAADKTSIFVGVAFLLIAGIIGTGGILWKSFVEYTGNAAGLPEVFSGIASRAPYEEAKDPESRREIIFTFVIPRGDLVQFIEVMQPKLDRIVEKTGKTARIDVSVNELEIINKLNRKLADYGSITAMAYINYRKSHQIRAVLERVFEPPKKVIFLVRNNDPAASLEDLRGYRIAYRGGDQLAGYLIPVGEVEKKGFAHSTFFKQEHFSENYSDSILGLQNEQYDCIVLTSNFFFEQPESVRNSMKIVHESPPVPGGVYIVNSAQRSPFEQTVVGNFMKLGSRIQSSEMFSGMFTTRQPDEKLFDQLEEDLVNAH